jgi:amidase
VIFLINIEELTINEAIKYIESGILTSLELTKMYFTRIAKYNRNGPKLNAVLEVNPEALHIAEAMDYERKYEGTRSLMHGIPVLLKDNINTGDKMHTSAGSLVLANSYASEDAFVVKRLRDSGAVILGKTNMAEFAGCFAENVHPEYSSRGGTVINPYNALMSPSGSSSGSAVAVASNLCTVAIGTETLGSIVSPARANCIVGIKPTVGLVSRSGIVPFSNSQDTAGPMARTVADAAILLGAMSGVDKNDPATWKSKWLLHQDYTPFLNEDKVANLRVGVYMMNFDKYNDEEKTLLDEAINVLLNHKVAIVKIEKGWEGLLDFNKSSVLSYEFKSGINYYLSKLKDRTEIKSLNDVISFNNKFPDTCLKYGQKRLEEAENTSGTLTEDEYIYDRLRDIEDARINGIDKVTKEFELDALLFFGCTSVADISGYPCIFVPAGFSNTGKSYGFTFVGKAFSEPALISLSYTYEKNTKRRKPPTLN